MILRYMDKLFSLQPRASAIEHGVICAVIGTAVLTALLALREPMAAVQPTVGSSGVSASGSPVGLRAN